MRLYVGVTDRAWFEFLLAQPGIDEVNFWRPGGETPFRALEPSELFLFKLHSPDNFIVGGGLFAGFTRLPIAMAWDFFGKKNGTASFPDLLLQISKRRHERVDGTAHVGCVLLEQPFFFPRASWIPAPSEWAPSIVQGKTYDDSDAAGRQLLDAVLKRLPQSAAFEPMAVAEGESRYGKPILVLPRLGQGSFRAIVTDAYDRRCSVTGERTLPALEAAHIQPFARNGTHHPSNGLLLRSDLHRLFDSGYLTVTPDLRLVVSKRIREEFENGRDYYAMAGRALREPGQPLFRPSASALQFHNESVFLG